VITPGQIFVDSIRVQNILFTDQNGAGWDLTTGPDLFYELTLNSSVLRTGVVLDDLGPQDLPVGWYVNPPYQVDSWTSTFHLDLYDYDSASENDHMVAISFVVNNIIAEHGYPRTITYRNDQGTIDVTVVFRWQ
jgi:hypothetical protein